MKRYDSYKKSTIQWVGEIPSHWEERKAKYVFAYKKDVVGEKCNEYDLLSLTLQGIIKRDLDNPTGKFPASFNTYQAVNNGDFVFCLFDNEETPRTVGLSSYNGMITSAYDVLTKKDESIDSRFLLYYYLTIDDAKLFKPIYKGLRKTIPFDSFMRYRIPLPPIKEQQIIVSYLDSKTSEIDGLVAKVEHEIELLKEYKQAEIARVVLHGLNSDAPTKPSGISWIGDIPAHWNFLRNKNIFVPHYEAVGDRKDIPLLSLTTEGVILRDVESGKGKFPKDFEKYNVVYPNNIIFCLFDIDETPRTVGLCHNYGMITNAYSTFKITDMVLPRFINYYYLVVDNIKGLRPYYTGLRKVVQSNKFMQLKVPVPSIEEQQQIVDYIDFKTTKIDRLVVELTYQVEYLKEYEQKLIADVVTGKINVQNN